MGWFGPKLEPGERVFYRAGVPRDAAPLGLIWAFFVGGWFANAMYRYPLVDEPGNMLFILGVFILPAIIVPVALALTLLRIHFPAWAITDRRIIVFRGLLRNRRQDIALDAVEGAWFAEGRLILEEGGRTVTIRATRVPADALTRSLGRWFPDSGKPTYRLGRILEPGEAVLLRTPALAWAILPAAMIAFGAYMLLDGIWSLTTGAETNMYNLTLGLLFALLAYWGIVDLRAHVSWTMAVTDRRVLRRLAHDPTRYEAFPLSAVEAVPPTTFGDRLFVRLRSREVQLPAKGESAERIRAAIAAAKGAA